MTTGVGVRIDAFSNTGEVVIKIGRDVQLNDYVHIGAISSVVIGDYVLIASRVFISDHNHGGFRGASPQSSTQIPPVDRPLMSSPVVVGDRVWLGEGVFVMPGVTIGDGAVIGAGAVVTKDVPSNSLSVGNPARVIKMFDLDACEWRRV